MEYNLAPIDLIDALHGCEILLSLMHGCDLSIEVVEKDSLWISASNGLAGETAQRTRVRAGDQEAVLV